MKGLKKRLFSVLMVMTLALGSFSTVYAEGNATMIKHEDTQNEQQVTKDSTTGFTLSVKRESDVFDIYRLTTLTWTENAGVQNVTIAWNSDVAEWIKSQKDFSADMYQTPVKLGKADNETAVINLLKAIRKDTALMEKLKAGSRAAYHEDGSNVDAGNSAGVTPMKAGDENNQTFSNAYSVTGLEFGLYFVDASSATRVYQPVLVDLMPEQTGPTGNWYLENDLTATLKYEDIDVTKTINKTGAFKGAYDIVREGEIVSFEVQSEIPKYQQNADGNYDFATFNGFDEMAQGYTMIGTSARIEYYDANGNQYHPTAKMTADKYGNATVTDDEGTYIATIAANSNVYYLNEAKDADVFYSIQYSDTLVKYLANINGELVELGNSTDDQTAYREVLNALNNKRTQAGLDAISYTSNAISKRDYQKSLVSIKFNYTRLMDAATYTNSAYADFNKVPDRFEVTYDAQVNSNSYVGNDNNTNRVTVYYVGDSAGNISTAETDVRAWTYAANIVKIDGSTNDYLAGAKFDLYRLDVTYCGGAQAVSEPSEADYSGYGFYADSDQNRTYDLSYTGWKDVLNKAVTYKNTQNGVSDAGQISSEYNELISKLDQAGGYETADKFMNKYMTLTSDEYKEMLTSWIIPKLGTSGMKYQPVAVKVDNCDKVETPHYHIEYYSTMWTDIESAQVADGDKGVTIVGLDPDTYLLIETQAPDGYNELSEAVKFTINQYASDGEEFKAADNTYRGFMDDQNINVTDGIYKLTIKNFTGIQLPSTGGIGTLLFTIIGIVIMVIAIVIIFTKSKKKRADY